MSKPKRSDFGSRKAYREAKNRWHTEILTTQAKARRAKKKAKKEKMA